MNITTPARKNTSRKYDITIYHVDLVKQIHALRIALLHDMDPVNRDALETLLASVESAYYFA